jgi:hypothetical protein
MFTHEGMRAFGQEMISAVSECSLHRKHCQNHKQNKK